MSASQITPELKVAWERTLAGMQKPIVLDLDKISELIDVRVTFKEAEIKYEDAAELTMFVHSLVEVPLKLKSFGLIIADSKTHYKLRGRNYRAIKGFAEGQWVAEDDAWMEFNPGSGFMLEPKAYYEVTFKAEPKQFIENEELQVAKLEIKMGTDRIHVILTKAASLLSHNRVFRQSALDGDLLENVKVKAHCYIKPT